MSAPSHAVPFVSAQSLFTDGLHLIFAFLPLRGLLPALRTCRQWCDAAYKERSRGVTCRSRPDQWPSVARSPLRHHINAMAGEVTDFNQIRPLSALPNLTRLHVSESAEHQSWADSSIRLPAAIEFARMWPQSLRILSLTIPGARSEGPQPRKQLMIDFLAHLPSIEDLSISFPFEPYSSFDLSPLCALQRLRSLDVNAELTTSQMEHLKWLPSLERLDCPVEWTAETLAALCRPPQRLAASLKYLRMDSAVLDYAHMSELTRLPLLESIQPLAMKVSAMPLLRSFTHLRSLRYGRSLRDEQHGPSEVFALIAACATLTSLELVSIDASADELAGLLMRLPLLESLSCLQLRLPTLRCLRCAPRLRSLVLYACTNTTKENLMDLTTVPSLRSLELTLTAAETPGPGLGWMSIMEAQLRARLTQVQSIELHASVVG